MPPPTGTDRKSAWLVHACFVGSAALLSGCASAPTAGDRLAEHEPRVTGAWVWTEPQRHGFRPDAAPPDTHDASIAVFAGVPARHASVATARRDGMMGVRDTDALPDRLAWPAERAPDLRRQRIYRSSVTADRWVFPTNRRDGSQGRRSYNFRSGY